MTYKLHERQVLYTGKKVRLELHHLEDEDGQKIQKEVVVHPGAVVILPWLDDRTILLIRNYRYTIHQTLWELPAGTLEKGEDPMNCAGRELQEETGFLATRMKPIGNFFASPGIMTEKMYAFEARGLKKTASALEPGEEIEVAPTLFTDAMAMIRDGQIHDGKTIATLAMFAMQQGLSLQ